MKMAPFQKENQTSYSFQTMACGLMLAKLFLNGCVHSALETRSIEAEEIERLYAKVRGDEAVVHNKKPARDTPVIGDDYASPIAIVRSADENIYESLHDAPMNVQLHFEDADLGQVVETILGDLIGVQYTLDLSLKDSVNFKTDGPISEKALMRLLKGLVERSGGALRYVDGSYHVTQASAHMLQKGETPEGKITILPVKQASARKILNLLETAYGTNKNISIDDDRNRLIIRGSDKFRRQVSSVAQLFDNEFYDGRQVAILPLSHVNVSSLFIELQGMLDFQNAGGLKVFPIERLNSLLVSAPSQEQVDRIWRHVRGLDRIRPGFEQLKIIHLKHADAEEVAGVLSQATDGQAGQSFDFQVGATGIDGEPDELDNRSRAANNNSNAVRIVPYQKNNALLVYAKPEQHAMIEKAVSNLDVAAPQVLIEASILEVALNDRLEFGVQGFLNAFSGEADIGFWETVSSNLATPVPGFNFIYSNASSSQAVVRALKSITDVRLLSSPSLVTINRQVATLQVGDEVPVLIQEVQDTATNNAPILQSVEYRQTGVILQVTPYINEDGVVALDIVQEVTNVPDSDRDADDLTPTFSRRNITTRASVQSGRPLVLGGLISEQVTKDERSIPGVHDLPLIGRLFGSTITNSRRTELLVILTPTVFETSDQAEAITLELIGRLGGGAGVSPHFNGRIGSENSEH